MSTSLILLSVLLGAFGVAYVSYAKTQRKAVPLIGGLVLLFLPYFTTNSYILVGILIAVILLSYFFNV